VTQAIRYAALGSSRATMSRLGPAHPSKSATAAMHRFPPVEDLRYLVGTTLTQITVDPYQVSFLLTDDGRATTLTSQYAFEFEQPNGQVEVYRPDRKSSNFSPVHFHQLLDSKVQSIDLSPDGLRLTLRFERGLQLTVLSELDSYEAGTIACGGGSQKYWVF